MVPGRTGHGNSQGHGGDDVAAELRRRPGDCHRGLCRHVGDYGCGRLRTGLSCRHADVGDAGLATKALISPAIRTATYICPVSASTHDKVRAGIDTGDTSP